MVRYSTNNNGITMFTCTGHWSCASPWSPVVVLPRLKDLISIAMECCCTWMILCVIWLQLESGQKLWKVQFAKRNVNSTPRCPRSRVGSWKISQRLSRTALLAQSNRTDVQNSQNYKKYISPMSRACHYRWKVPSSCIDKGSHPIPKSLFFYKVYKRPLAPPLVL